MPRLLSESELHALRLDIQEALAVEEQNLIDSLMEHIEAMKSFEEDTLKARDADEAGMRSKLTELEAKVRQQKEVMESLAANCDRLKAQHDKAVTENKGLHTVVDQHNGIRLELERRLETTSVMARKTLDENDRLRKRNGKLAKKLEMKRI